MIALLDTNIVLRHLNRNDPRQPTVSAALETLLKQGAVLRVCQQVVVEFWAVSTRPTSANGLGKEPADTHRELSRFLEQIPALPEPAGLLERWMETCSQHHVRGRQVFDARLSAFAEVSGVYALVTLNPSDFARLTSIKLVVPN